MRIKWEEGFKGLEEAYPVRRQVFVLEQHVPEDVEIDELDSVAEHLIVYDGDLPVATGRLFKKDGSVIFGRICVLREYRGKDIGRLLMEEMLSKAAGMDAVEIRLDSQVYAIKFYRRFGFIERGGVFKDAGIDHVEMVRTGMEKQILRTNTGDRNRS